MTLFIERNTDFDTECIIEEDTQQVKNYMIRGPFLQSEIRNHNNRIYPKTILKDEVEKYIKEKIEKQQGLGELGHPNNPSINLDRVSHKIIALKEEGNNFIGEAKIIDTPFGKIVKNLMDEKIRFGVSSRGLGSIKDSSGVNIVCEYRIVTPADIVSDPSGPQCFVDAIMENREWVWENDRLIEKETPIKQLINDSAKKKELDEERLLVLFNHILNLI